MGRQIAIGMNARDERDFLDFVRIKSDVVVLTRHAGTVEALKMQQFPDHRRIVQFFLWNTSFPWEPSIGPSTTGTPYIQDLSTAPVVEYDRQKGRRLGRLYWDKLPSVEGTFKNGPLAYRYDVERFEAWYEELVAWIKANSTVRGPKNDRRYYLKNAWRSGAWFFAHLSWTSSPSMLALHPW